jgi:hypothetical protein
VLPSSALFTADYLQFVIIKVKRASKAKVILLRLCSQRIPWLVPVIWGQIYNSINIFHYIRLYESSICRKIINRLLCLCVIAMVEQKINDLKLKGRNTKGGSITIPLTSSLTGFVISCMTTDNLSFYLQNRLIQTSQTGGSWYNDTSRLLFPAQGFESSCRRHQQKKLPHILFASLVQPKPFRFFYIIQSPEKCD